MKVNDILVSRWGYEQTNINFYKVIKVTKTMATIQELDIIELKEDMAGWEMPIDKVKGQPFRRKIHTFNDEEFICIDEYSRARKWSKKKQRYTSYS